ncbi:MAG: aldo/keto reductase [Tepidiphilus sp.]|uniref:aldo/keto reductase n=1 Tax=Tepidiphilus succinatimandens TaxID=224436 RepID=UPI00112F06A0|nr:aldo/keto reductase [Tepidiphilus succinatimandens]MBP6998739.1 aldo/keto reductase [Tepidiphilus sp.]
MDESFRFSMLRKPAVSSVIIGATQPAQLQDSLATVQWTLTEEEIRALDEVSALPRLYSKWILEFARLDRTDPKMRL